MADAADNGAANGKVPSATPTDKFSLDPAYQGNDGAVVVGGDAVAATTDTVIDSTVTDTGAMKKQNFHTGLDPVSRTKNSAQPTEFDAVAAAADKERYAQLSSLDTGSSPVWSVVAGTDASGNDRAVVVGTVATVSGGVGNGAIATRDAGLRPLRLSLNGNDGVGNRTVAVGDGHVRPVAVGAPRPDDEIIATSGNTHKSSFPQDAGIQRQGCNAGLARVAAAGDTVRGAGCPRPAGMTSHSNFRADDGDNAAVVGTVAIVGGGVGDSAVATVTVTNPDDATVATSGSTHKSSFPRTRESRTNNSAKPTEFNAGVTDTVTVDRDANIVATAANIDRTVTVLE